MIRQNKFIPIILFIIFILTVLIQQNKTIRFPKTSTSISDDTSCTSFIVIGDWGIVEQTNKDYNNKLQVAKAMKTIHNKYNTSFIISVGDQYYDNGIHLNHSLQDLETSSDLNYWFINHFEETYDESLKPWYLILGNHDMRGSAKALFKYSNISNRWNIPYNYYYKDFGISGSENMLFRMIFIDTSSIMCYNDDRANLDSLEDWSCDEAWYHHNDDRKSKYNEKDEDKFINREVQIQWIKEKILEADKDERIRDIFITGHHGLWSNGPHGCPKIMGKNMRPLFTMSNKIRGYFYGHNHGLEHFKWTKDDGFEVHTFLSGAGASLHEFEGERCNFEQLVDSEDEENEEIEMQYLGVTRGFMTVHFECDGGDDISMIFWNQDADHLYEVTI